LTLRKEQFTRLKRYFLNYSRHATWEKVANLAKVEYKLARKDPDLKNCYPYTLFVEISNSCNLKCPLCMMGQGRIIPRKNMMSVGNYRSLVEPLKDYLFQVSLYNWGEPFLNRDVYEIIRYSTAQNIGTVISSNFSVPIDAERLVKSGLEHLIISSDGITQPVYEKYRAGVNIDLVLDNLKKVVEAKKAAGSRFPYIEWQCLVTKWNESQLEEIKRTALDLGSDEVRFCNINFYAAENRQEAEEEWLPRDPSYRFFFMNEETARMDPRRSCFWLWRTAVVNVDGGVIPCCFFDIPDWGNVLKEPFSLIWNNEKYTEARMRFGKGERTGKIETICDDCDIPFVHR